MKEAKLHILPHPLSSNSTQNVKYLEHCKADTRDIQLLLPPVCDYGIVQIEAASICFHLRRCWTISNILQGLQPGPGSGHLVCQLYWLLSATIILFHENWNGSLTLEFAIWQWGLLELRNLLKNKRSDERNNWDFNKLLILHSMKVRTLQNSERIAAHQNNEADLPFKLFFFCYTN